MRLGPRTDSAARLDALDLVDVTPASFLSQLAERAQVSRLEARRLVRLLRSHAHVPADPGARRFAELWWALGPIERLAISDSVHPRELS